MIKKAIISGGGTGGHIFPALAIAQALKTRYPQIEILFVGANGRMEMERIPQAGFEIVGLDVEGLDRRRPWRNFKVILKYIKAIVAARDIIKQFQPDICIGVGGYISAPTLKAAQTLGVPTIIQEQNSYAGKANKFVSRRCERICVAYPNMQRYFMKVNPKSKIVLTGNPIRPQIEYIRATREEALKYFGLPEDTQKVVLVIGGSLGARTINESIGSKVDEWTKNGVTLIWQTGKVFAEKAKNLAKPYHPYIYTSAFIDRMDFAYTLADIVISRAGASTISELQILGKAAILVPSPNVVEDHQTKNALALSQRNAAILVTDKEANEYLVRKTIDLIHNQEEQAILRKEISKMAIRDSANLIVDEIDKVLNSKKINN